MLLRVGYPPMIKRCLLLGTHKRESRNARRRVIEGLLRDEAASDRRCDLAVRRTAWVCVGRLLLRARCLLLRTRSPIMRARCPLLRVKCPFERKMLSRATY